MELHVSDLPLVRSRRIGSLTVHAIEAGIQRLDGGAMFGVVPKPLWERRVQPDEKNRIPLALRCLLVETPHALVLVDTGLGNKESDKFMEIYGVENAGTPTRLEDGLRHLGFAPEDIGIVVNTHLHFDHAGGNTWRTEDGVIHVNFPNARYYVQRTEWQFANRPNERTRASYFPHNVSAIEQAGKWVFLDGEMEVTDGLTVFPTPGHTPGHQSLRLASDGEVACYLADVCPTSAHLPLPWIMGYDVEPLVTLESKRRVLGRAQSEEWLLIFEHDPTIPWGRLDPQSDRFELREDSD